VLAALTGSGLAAAAGLNAWIPFLLVAVLSRTTDLIQLPAGYSWVRSDWAIAIGTGLLIIELVLDKIPVVDHLNDLISTVIRPTVGGLIASATFSARNLDHSAWMRHNPWVGVILGVVIAGATHVTKSAIRPVVNVSTAGFGTPVVSSIEDVLSVVLSVVAIFAPVLVVVILAAMVWTAVVLFRRLAAWRRRRQGRRADEFASLSDDREGMTGS
jgi:hypothetical protein